MCQQPLQRIARGLERHGCVGIVHADLVVAHGVAGVATHFRKVEVERDEFNVTAGAEDDGCVVGGEEGTGGREGERWKSGVVGLSGLGKKGRQRGGTAWCGEREIRDGCAGIRGC